MRNSIPELKKDRMGQFVLTANKTFEERVAYANLVKGQYNTWANNNKHNIQISVQRSGRVWFSSMILYCIEQSRFPMERTFGDYPIPDYYNPYLTTHWYGWLPLKDDVKYILVIRDPREQIMSLCKYAIRHKKTIKESWIVNCCVTWRKYLELLKYNTFLIQYEQICLQPELTLTKVLDFTGLSKIKTEKETVEYLDKVKNMNNIDRYNKHAIKWQRCGSFFGKFVPIIWNELKDIMPYFGYLENGHNMNMFTR